jgi:hypothetical protein
VHAIPTLESSLREAFNVAGVAGTLKTVQKHDLRDCLALGLVFHHENARSGFRLVNMWITGKPSQIDLARPEIGCNREKVRVAHDRLELAMHVLILNGSAIIHFWDRFSTLVRPFSLDVSGWRAATCLTREKR